MRAERDIHHIQGDTGHGTAMGSGDMGRGGGDTHHTYSDTKSKCNQLEGGVARVRSPFVCVGFILDLKKPESFWIFLVLVSVRSKLHSNVPP